MPTIEGLLLLLHEVAFSEEMAINIVTKMVDQMGLLLTNTIPTVTATPKPDENVKLLKSATYYAGLFRTKLTRLGFQLKYIPRDNNLTICKTVTFDLRPHVKVYHSFRLHCREVKNRYFLFNLISLQREDADNDQIMEEYINFVNQNGCPEFFDEDTPFSPSQEGPNT